MKETMFGALHVIKSTGAGEGGKRNIQTCS